MDHAPLPTPSFPLESTASPVSDPVWGTAWSAWLNARPPIWNQAWQAARASGQGGPSPVIDTLPEVWSRLNDAWALDPATGRRFAWEVGHRAWLPTLKVLVQAGLAEVATLEKPRAGRAPLRLAESMHEKHPAVFRWLVEQDEPADAPWGDGSAGLRDTIQVTRHKKLARLWLQRPQEHAIEHLIPWLNRLWTHNIGDEVQDLVWNAWDAAMAALPPGARDRQEQQAARSWAEQVNRANGWPSGEQGASSTERFTRHAWERWRSALGDGFLKTWIGQINQRGEAGAPPFLSPAFIDWANVQAREAFQRYEQRELQRAAAGAQVAVASEPRLRSRL